MEERLLNKTPRLYTAQALSSGETVTLPDTQSHYLKNVMRMAPGDDLRLFNGRDGEWHAVIETLDKKRGALALVSRIRPQPLERQPVHLLFTPIKKARLDWLIEKAVELGATDLHPIISQQTDVRQINEERTRAQMTEAAEQCERLDVPRLHPLTPLKTKLGNWPGDIPVLMAIERENTLALKEALPSAGPIACLVGPEGGFSPEERQWPEKWPFLKSVSLGEDILRTETAAIFMLASIHMKNI